MKKIYYIMAVFMAAAMLTACNNKQEQPDEAVGSTSETSTALAAQSDSVIQQADGTSAISAEESAADTLLAETTAAEDNITSETAQAVSETTAAETTANAPETTATAADTTEPQDSEELPVFMLDDPIMSEQEETTKAPTYTMPPTENIPAVTTTVSSKAETTTAVNTTTTTEDKPIELPFVPAARSKL